MPKASATSCGATPSNAVRWNASGTAATELGNLGISSGGYTFSEANAINTAGVVVGDTEKYSPLGPDLGLRAVRWSAAGTVATELGNLGTDSNGFSVSSGASAINSAGTIVGGASKYTGGTYLGHYA